MPGMADRRQFLGLLDQIDGSIHRTVRILNRIRSESESAQLDMKPLDLRDVVSQSVALIKPELQRLHVNFKSEGEDKALICLGDHLALSQVFFNLLRNAVQAMGNQPLKRLTVSYLSDGLYAVVLVRDSGSGLSAEMLSTWGEPMTSTKSDGLGMGLAISRDIMNRHNGHLLLRNQMSGGAEAYVQLPLWTAAS